MTVGTFCLYKNEAKFMRAHIQSWICFVDEMIIFDGDSTDGTVEIVKDIRKSHPFGHRIKLFENKDPKDLREDYTRMFNECLHSLSTDYAVFAHGDMLLDEPGEIGFLGDAHAYTSHMRSFAGEPEEQLYEIKEGRADAWKNIYRLKNPDLGLHYFGAYGAVNEDCYFSKITGAAHEFHGTDLASYPYEVKDSGIRISHFSDVRTPERRMSRMMKCLINQGYSEADASSIAKSHPRVTLQDGKGFSFEPCEYPDILKESAAA